MHASPGQAGSGPRVRSLQEAIAELQSPAAFERFATLTGEAALIVDLPAQSDEGRLPDGRAVERARERLGQLACPTIAVLGPDPSPLAESLLPAFDLALEGAQPLATVLKAVEANPQASLALIQLHRKNEVQDVHQGLISESLVYSTLQSGTEFAEWRKKTSARPLPPDHGPAVICEREGALLRLSLNRPQRHNAFSVSLRDGLSEALLLAADDPSIERVLLRGNGPSFCSGGDLDEFGSFPDPATAHLIRSTRNPARLLAGIADRVVAEVHGACIGAGCELPAFGSVVRAHPESFFALPEVRMGLVPGAGGTVSVLARIGRHRANAMALSGERIDARTALAWGLVDELLS